MGGGIFIKNTNKNAFTLIELLAIIVILAIIAVITVPIILNIIENSRKGAAVDSAYGYKDAVYTAYVDKLSAYNDLKLDGTYTVGSDGSLSGDFNDSEVTSLSITLSGTIPTSGSLIYSNNKFVEGWLGIGDYKVTFDEDGAVTTEKNVSSSVVIDDNDDVNQGGGSQTPSNPYLTRFDGNYKYMIQGVFSYPDNWTTTLDSTWYGYARKDTSTNIIDVCAVFSEGTVCLEYGDYSDDFIDEVDATIVQKSTRPMTSDEQSGGYCYVDNYGTEYDSNYEIIGCYKCPDGYDYDSDSDICYNCPYNWQYDSEIEKCIMNTSDSTNSYMLSGYPKAKMEEAVAAGASCYAYGQSEGLYCYDDNTAFSLYKNGTVGAVPDCDITGSEWDRCGD